MDPHEPGDSHRYRIICEVCGAQGMMNLSIHPERYDPKTVSCQICGKTDEHFNDDHGYWPPPDGGR